MIRPCTNAQVTWGDPSQKARALRAAQRLADMTGQVIRACPANEACDLAGFSDDARKAIQTAPDYFVWWYTAKSIGLAVVFAAFTFMLGRASRKDCR